MSEYNKQRFYWIKLTDTFMSSDSVDFLMSQKDGANYVLIYEMLCLKTVNNGGFLSFTVGDIIVPYVEEKLQRDLKWFSIDTIRVALALYKRLGLVYEEDNGVLKIAEFDSLVGSQTISAAKKQEQRKTRDNVLKIESGQKADICPPDIEIEKEIDSKESKKEERNNNTNNSAHACACESYESVIADMELEDEVKPMLWSFIKHCQLNKRTLTNDKLTNILFEMDKQRLTPGEKIQVLQNAINGGYYDIKR